MHPRFGLTLVATHTCNLRCSYCYAGTSRAISMSDEMARHAIRRGVQSVAPNGRLEIGFFGGEPMLEAPRIARWMDYAREQCKQANITLAFSITTNGTITTDAALAVMTDPQTTLAISFDGTPSSHDHHRRTAAGQGSSDTVLKTIRILIDRQFPFYIINVISPDTAGALADGFRFLIDHGVRKLEPTLNLWAKWEPAQIDTLEVQIAQSADLWHASLPTVAISWFDHKALEISLAPRTPPPRCGYGTWEIAIAPSGRMYPCERLVGDDPEPRESRTAAPGRPWSGESPDPLVSPLPATARHRGSGEGSVPTGRDAGEGAHGVSTPQAANLTVPSTSPILPGHVMDCSGPFTFAPAALRDEQECTVCEAKSLCSTDCRCGNYVRTGDARRPDELLCRWNQACLFETARILDKMAKQSETSTDAPLRL